MSISIINDAKGGTKLKILTKKLSSGKCQVKFYVNSGRKRDVYGYMLADAEQTLKEVVLDIVGQIKHVKDRDTYYHNHLYSLGKKNHLLGNFILFKN